MAKGRSEGRAEGKIEEARSIATTMKMNGLPPHIIAECTKLTLDEVNRL